jgi:hypothetical protein
VRLLERDEATGWVVVSEAGTVGPDALVDRERVAPQLFGVNQVWQPALS